MFAIVVVGVLVGGMFGVLMARSLDYRCHQMQRVAQLRSNEQQASRNRMGVDFESR
jgi:hypothetical protein